MTKKSTLAARQKLTVIFIAAAIVLLAIVAMIVNYFVSLGEYIDIDETKYTVKEKDGVYALYDKNGTEMKKTKVDGKYYFVTKLGTLVAISEDGVAKTHYVVDTDEGESVASGQSLLIFPKVDSNLVLSLEVTNKTGTYSFVRTTTGSMVIKGYERVAYNSENFSYLSAFCGFLVAMKKYPAAVVDQYGYGEYGLDEPQASYTLRTLTGLSYTIDIGDTIVSGNGYYVRLRGRDTVYIVNGYYSMLLASIEDFVQPAITIGLSTNNYPLVYNFKVYSYTYDEDGTKHIACDTALTLWPLAERENTEYATQVYKMTDPKLFNYIPNTTAVTDTMLGIAQPTTARVVKLGVTDEVLTEYGLDKPEKALQFEFKPVEGNDNYIIKTRIFVSPMTENRTHYVFSAVSLSEDGGETDIPYPGINAVLEVDRANLPFMSWGAIDWVEEYYFHRNIMLVDTLEFKTPEKTYLFTLQADEDDVRKVTASVDGVTYNIPVEEFKIYYRNLLFGALYDSTGLTSEQHNAITDNDSNFQFSYRIKTNLNHLDNTYAFYRMSDTKSYITIDGGGEFYVLTSFVNKYVSDIEDLINGVPLVPLAQQ